MYSMGETKKIVNGQVVQDILVKSEYDGKTLHTDKMDNNKLIHFTLNDKDLKNMLKNNTSKLGLLERLNEDYIGKQQRSRKQRSRKQRSRRQRSRRQRSRRQKGKK